MREKNIFNVLLLFVFLVCGANTICAQIYINEFVASNEAGISDENGEFEDWVELYNAGSTPVDIGGHYLSDDLEELTLWQIPTTASAETTIPAGGFLLLWFDKDIDAGVLHVDAKLSSNGEDIVLTATDGTTILDAYTYGAQLTDVSEGRVTDGNDVFSFFSVPTPKLTNVTSVGMTLPPTFSISGGLHSGSTSVALSTPFLSTIYYTTDGSLPNLSSNQYTTPINISTPTPIRAMAVGAGLAASQVVTQTYLIDVSHVYPIVAVTGDADKFFDEETGIFSNPTEDIEININAEFYEPDGTFGFNQLVEAKVTGTSSAFNDQRSLSLKAKGDLGNSVYDYPIFPDEPFEEYRSFLLRNSGNDWATTGFRDAAVSSLIRDLSDIDDLISTPQVNYQAYRPSILYLNGEYWGIYNLRERPDKAYIKTRFGLDNDEIDFIDRLDNVREGDIDNWNDLQEFLANNSLTNIEKYNQVDDWVALDEYMDYVIFNLFADNQDWPGNNNRRFRERVADAKWHFIMHDLDLTFGLLTSQGWNTGFAGDNALNRLLQPNATEAPNPEWSTRLFVKLSENEVWRQRFINRTADQLNVLFTPERINQRLDDFLAAYAPEIEQHRNRWLVLFQQEENTDIMRSFANERVAALRNHYLEAFAEIQNTAEVRISTLPVGAGAVALNTLYIDEEDNNEAWTGTYFTGIDIPVKAIAKPGFIFQHWEGLSGEMSDSINLNLTGDGSLTAVFALDSSQIKKVLFVGNSYTGYNNLAQLTADVAESVGDTLFFDNHTPNGATFMSHVDNTTVQQKIAAENWDYVVLQGQSQELALPLSQVDVETFPFATQLCENIRANNSCTRPMFYMTWGRENGDQENCEFYEPLCTYEGMDSLLNARYQIMGEENEAYVSPVGAVWHYLRDNHPEIDLYEDDGSHPSAAGSYAAACTFYTMIFRKNPDLISFDFSLSVEDALTIRNAARVVTYEHLEEWNVGIYDPVAAFSTESDGENFTFNNHSTLAENYQWNFGDGATSVLENPQHSYTFMGNNLETFPVTLIAEKCGISDNKTTEILVDFSVNIEEIAPHFIHVYPNPTDNMLYISEPNQIRSYQVTNATGQLFLSGNKIANGAIDLSNLQNGIYWIKFFLKDGRKILKKVVKQKS